MVSARAKCIASPSANKRLIWYGVCVISDWAGAICLAECIVALQRAVTRFLLTNDDGIDARGLAALAEALREVGDVYTVAPSTEMSGASHSLTLTRPLRIRNVDERRWCVDGTPTDCVIIAYHKILPQDAERVICVSGINHGENLGDDASYSGTVAGALEATILGMPSFALSLAERGREGTLDFTGASHFAGLAARKILDEGLPNGILLNINIPSGDIKGVRVTRQGIKNSKIIFSNHLDPRGESYYWNREECLAANYPEGTDLHAIDLGFVSVTPLSSELTNYSALSKLRLWNSIFDSNLRCYPRQSP